MRSGSAASNTANRGRAPRPHPSWASIRGSPPGAGTSTSPATAARSRITGRSSSGCVRTPISPCGGRSTTAKASDRTPWSWSDVVSSWSWDGPEGAPVTVEVYADADEVELVVNGRSVGRRPAGAAHRYRAEFETTFEAGLLEAVARRGRCRARANRAPLGLGAGAARGAGRPARDRRASGGSGLRRADPGRRRRRRAQLGRSPGGRATGRPGGAPGPGQREPGVGGGFRWDHLHDIRWTRPRRRPADRRGADHPDGDGRGVPSPAASGSMPGPDRTLRPR